MKRDFLNLSDLTRAELEEILHLAATLKRELKAGKRSPLLAGKTLAMIFEKPSLRTRVTFEVGMNQLGGYAMYLTPKDIQLGERESVGDIARNLERWVDLIMARTFAHTTLLELAHHAGVPVINGLSNLLHPCQVLSDCFTLLEKRGRLDGLRIAFVGDANNVANSWFNAAVKFGFDFVLACPPGYEPSEGIFENARAQGARVRLTNDPAAAAEGADVLYTDVWVSMGKEAETAQRIQQLTGYQLNTAAVKQARPDALVMHCLPAYRGREIDEETFEANAQTIFDEAENRLHVQKAILNWIVS